MKLINQILSPDNLRLAWQEVASKHSAPGVDEVTVERWQRNWEERLTEVEIKTIPARGLKLLWILRKNGAGIG